MGRLPWSLALVLAVAAACGTDDPLPDDPPGDPVRTVYLLEFPTIEVGGKATAFASVRAGKQPVFLSPVEIVPPFHSDLVAVEKLEPGGVREIRFTFEPTQPGEFEQEVEIRATGTTGRYRLRATALPRKSTYTPKPRTDRFEDVRPRQDVLFVLDDSAAMEAALAAIPAQLADLFATLDEMRIDWRLAATTTGLGSPCAGGTLLGQPPVLDPAVEDPAAWMADALAPDLCGGSGRGLEAAAAAAGEFRRPGAGLSVVVISTRDDRGEAPVEDLVGALRSRVERPELLRLLAVVGDEGGGCDAEPAERWAEAARQLGGALRSICAEDWEIDEHIAKQPAFGMPFVFPLGAYPHDTDGDGLVRPEAGEIQVLVDGEAIPPAIGDGEGWRWDPFERAIVFPASETPPPGATVEIVYAEICASA